MRQRLCSLVLVTALAAAPASLAGQETPGESDLRGESSTRETARFLLAPIGARSVGLAGAVTASRGDHEGVLWNPASAAGVDRPTAFLVLADDFGTSSQVLGFLGVWGDVRAGLTYYHFDLGSIDARDEQNRDLGTLSVDDDVLVVTGGYELTPHLEVGLNYKLVRLSSACSDGCESFDGRSIGHAFDLGVIGRIGSVPGLALGATVRNLGPGIRYAGAATTDPMPTRLRVGVSLDALRTLAPQVRDFDVLLQADVQETVTEFDDLEGYFGAQASFQGILYLRGGYAWSTAGRRGATLGIGLRYDRLIVDVGRAFNEFSELDTSTPFQLSVGFGF